MNPKKSNTGKKKRENAKLNSDTTSFTRSRAAEDHSQQKSENIGKTTPVTRSLNRSQSPGDVARGRDVNESTSLAKKGIRKIEGPINSKISEVEREVREKRSEVMKWIFGNPLAEPVPQLYRRAKKDAIVPKSAALRPEAFYMAYTGQPADIEYIKTMATVAKKYEFEVRVIGMSKDSDKLLLEDTLKTLPIKIIKVDYFGIDKWVEDSGSFGGKTISIAFPPLPLSKVLTNEDAAEKFHNDMDLHILHERYERYHEKSKLTMLKDKKAYYAVSREYKNKKIAPLGFDCVGKVALTAVGRSKIAIGIAEEGWELRADICHLEGGNVLTGILPNGKRYALVGWDSVSQSRFFLALEGLAIKNNLNPSNVEIRKFIEEGLPEEKMRDLIAADLGLDANQVHFIEEPADFHLDLSMGILTNNCIILDDPDAAAEALIKEANQNIIELERLQGKITIQWETLRKETKERIKSIITDGDDPALLIDLVDMILDQPNSKIRGTLIAQAIESVNTKEVKELFKQLETKPQRETLREETKERIKRIITDGDDQAFTIDLVDMILKESNSERRAPLIATAIGAIDTAIGAINKDEVKELFKQLETKLDINTAEIITTLQRAIEQTREEAALKSYYMEKIAEQLNKFVPEVNVVRGPLAFEGDLTQGKAKILPRMNFANFEAGTGKNGQKFLILNGGTKGIEDSTRAWFEEKVGFGGDIFFVDAKASEASLKNHGGMGCRAKACGKVED